MARNDNNARPGNGASTQGTTSGTEPLAAFILTGKTGSGKSTFIKLLGGRDLEGREPIVSGGIESCTQKPTVYVAMVGGRKIILLDTPGFDDSGIENLEILNDIAANLYTFALQQNEIKTRGVIFLHDISETRLSGSQKKTLEILKAICGPKGMNNCIIGTTMWNTYDRPKFDREVVREGELIRKHWQGILKTTRIPEDDKDTIVGIINDILARPPVLLLIQEEMLIPPHTVENTTAGKIVIPEVHAENERLRKENEENQGKFEEEAKKRDEESRRKDEEFKAEFTKIQQEQKRRDEENQKQNTEKERLHKEEMRREREERQNERREDSENRRKEDEKRREEDRKREAKSDADWTARLDKLIKDNDERERKSKEDVKKAQEEHTRRLQEEEERTKKVLEALEKTQRQCETRPWWKKILTVVGAIGTVVAAVVAAPVTAAAAAAATIFTATQ